MADTPPDIPKHKVSPNRPFPNAFYDQLRNLANTLIGAFLQIIMRHIPLRRPADTTAYQGNTLHRLAPEHPLRAIPFTFFPQQLLYIRQISGRGLPRVRSLTTERSEINPHFISQSLCKQIDLIHEADKAKEPGIDTPDIVSIIMGKMQFLCKLEKAEFSTLYIGYLGNACERHFISQGYDILEIIVMRQRSFHRIP